MNYTSAFWDRAYLHEAIYGFGIFAQFTVLIRADERVFGCHPTWEKNVHILVSIPSTMLDMEQEGVEGQVLLHESGIGVRHGIEPL